MKLFTLLFLTVVYCSFGQTTTAGACYYKGIAQDSASGKTITELSLSKNSTVLFLDQYKCHCNVTQMRLTHVRGKRPLSFTTIGGNKLRSSNITSLFPNFQTDDRIVIEVTSAEDKDKKACKMMQETAAALQIVP